nr:MAG TPA: hypothetical protein [Caudoviricetes sp.]
MSGSLVFDFGFLHNNFTQTVILNSDFIFFF